MESNPILETRQLKKTFVDNMGKEIEVLKGIDFSLHKGEVISIIGPSGCGKSTFLRCLNGLEMISSGSIIFEGLSLDSKSNWRLIRRKIGMVFQSYELFPHFNVLDNIILAPIKILNIPKDEAIICPSKSPQNAALTSCFFLFPFRTAISHAALTN